MREKEQQEGDEEEEEEDDGDDYNNAAFCSNTFENGGTDPNRVRVDVRSARSSATEPTITATTERNRSLPVVPDRPEESTRRTGRSGATRRSCAFSTRTRISSRS